MTLSRPLPQHLDDLRRSGLSDDTIANWGAYSIELDQKGVLNQLGFPHIDPPALVLPVLPPDRTEPTNDIILKPDVPWRTNGKQAKYLCRRSARNRIHAPLAIRKRLSDVSAPLVITEGQKKSEKAAQEGICAVSLSGVWNWRDKVGEDSFPIADFDLIPLRGRSVFLTFDSDATTNVQVRRAEGSLGAFLLKSGARVMIKRLPAGPNGDKVGLDDYLLTHTVEEFWQLKDEQLPATPKTIETSIVRECFANITAKAIEWDWPERIPKAKLTLFTGNPDEGKSTVACDIVARYTQKRPWPDGAENDAEPGDALMMVAEDDPADTVKPRLLAAGADLNRVHLLRCVCVAQGSKTVERMLALDQDLALLEVELKENPKIKLVVIDPVTSYLGRSNLNKEQEVRAILVPIKDLADRTNVTFIGIAHFNKRADVPALQRVGGAVALAGVSRAVWLFTKNPEVEGEHLMLLGKGNLTKKRTGLRYRIVEKLITLPDGTKTGVPVVDWLPGESTADADDALAAVNNPMERKNARAKRFLIDLLADGEKPSDAVIAAGREKGFGRNTLFEAKKILDISAYKQGKAWWWGLPKTKKREPGEEG